MKDKEAILISGAEQFSSYTGYGHRFTYTGPVVDPNPISPDNQRLVSIVAIDATPYSSDVIDEEDNQFNKKNVLRELNKAFCGFSFATPLDDVAHDRWVPVATGNWGCGAFEGDKELKTLIQWAAASRAGRTIRYYSFHGDGDLAKRQREAASCLVEHGVTVAQLFSVLVGTKLSQGRMFGEVMRAVKELSQ